MSKEPLSDQIRQAVLDSGLSRAEVCRAIGITKGPLSRFMAGKDGLTLATLDRLAELLDLNIVVGPAKSKRARTCRKGG